MRSPLAASTIALAGDAPAALAAAYLKDASPPALDATIGRSRLALALPRMVSAE